jgi:ABC-2 type transport system ATP-binding protein
MNDQPVAGAPSRVILEARGLRRNYGDLIALGPLDLEIGGGGMVALVGPNGAGKTTLLRAAAGLLEPSQGTIQIGGVRAGSLKARAATSYIPDAPALYDDLSLNEHLEYIARLHGAEDWSQPGARLLERLGLDKWADNLPSQYSRGMRQKASIALGLVRPFSLLLADEPFDGLDPQSRTALVELLQEAAEGGAAVVVSTHRREVGELADRCIALYDGELAYDGPPTDAVLTGFVPDDAGSERGAGAE